MPRQKDVIAEAERHWLEHWGGDAVPAMVAITSIMRVHQILLARLNRLLGPWDLTFARYEALMLLYYSRHGSLPLGKIGSRLQVHPTSVTNTIDRLERQGFVARRPNPRDGRGVLARLTDAGRSTLVRATADLTADGFGLTAYDEPALESLFALLRTLRVDAGDFRSDHAGTGDQ